MSCCPSIWWCTPDGPVEVTPDGSGVYTRPAGATGHPYKSLADAMAGCPEPLLYPCNGADIPTDSVVYITLADLTGGLVGLFPSNSFPLVRTGAAWEGAIVDNDGRFWTGSVSVTCNEGSCGGGQFRVVVRLTPGTCSASSTAGSGWTAETGSNIQFYRCKAPGEPLFAAGGETIFTSTITCTSPSLSGTLTVIAS